MKILGILTCFILALGAAYLADIQSMIGGPMIGLIMGMLLVNIIPVLSAEFKAGTAFVSRKFLMLGIVLAGGTLSFTQVVGEGVKALPLIVVNLVIALGVAGIVGKKLRVSREAGILVGCGTGICGGTAIVTIAPIIKAKEEDIAYAMTAIFLFDVLAAFCFPYLANSIRLSDAQFGFLAGTAINDTSSVTAAQATFGALIGNSDYALPVTIKLTRTTMLIVLAVAFTIFEVRRLRLAGVQGDGLEQKISVGATIMQVFPWFVVYFLLMTLANTIFHFSEISLGSFTLAKALSKAYKFFITMALAGVGFKVKFKDLFTKGARPIILGGCTWLCLAASSLAFVFLFQSFIE